MKSSVLSALFRYVALHFRPSDYYNRKFDALSDAGPELVVSFTTLPHRIGKIRPMIRSVMDQTVRPSRIILNIPRKTRGGVRYQIPEFIQSNPAVLVREIEEDLGPATKLLPTLMTETEALILVLDDDQIYPQNLVENYLHYHRLFPGDALTVCGWKVPEGFDHSGRVIWRGGGLQITDPKGNIMEPQIVDIVQGVSSYLVKRSFFADSVFDYQNAPEAAFYSDDIWISGHLAANQTVSRVVPSHAPYLRLELLGLMNGPSLLRTVNRDGTNNAVLYRYFEEAWIK